MSWRLPVKFCQSLSSLVGCIKKCWLQRPIRKLFRKSLMWIEKCVEWVVRVCLIVYWISKIICMSSSCDGIYISGIIL